jgi:YVTN family beta-propeller protein
MMRSSNVVRLGFLAALPLLAGCAAAMSAATQAPPSPAVVATIPLAGFGTDVKLSPDGRFAYVAMTDKVQVIDTGSRAVARTITTGDMPYRMAITRDGSTAYAVDLMQRCLLQVDLAGGRLARRIPVDEPQRPALRPDVALVGDESQAIVSISDEAGDDELIVVDLKGGAPNRTHGIDFHPGPLATSADGGTLYVAGCHGLCSDGTVHALSLPSLAPLGRTGLPTLPGELARPADGGRLWATDGRGAGVTPVDPVTGSSGPSIHTDAGSLGVAVAPGGRRVYVTNFDAGTLSVVDPSAGRALRTVPIGRAPRAVALSPDGGTAWVTHSSPVLSVIDVRRLEQP